MEEIESKIVKVEGQIENVERQLDDIRVVLLKKDQDWSENEKLLYMNRDRILKEKEQLMKKEEQLRSLMIIEKQQQLPGIEMFKMKYELIIKRLDQLRCSQCDKCTR